MTMIGDPVDCGAGRGRTVFDLLVVMPSTSFGGAEKHTLDLCDSFAAAGMRVCIVSTTECLQHPALRPSDHAKLDRAVDWRDSEAFETNVCRQKEGIKAVLRNQRFDCAVLCAPWPHYAFGLQEALMEQCVPHLIVAHLFPRAGSRERSYLPNMLGLTGGAVDQLSFAWAAVSWPVARRTERMFHLPPNSVAHIPNGVDVFSLSADERRRRQEQASGRLGLAPDRKIVLFLGRLEAAKGADLLPGISEGLADLDAMVICAGAGAFRSSLETAPASERGLLKLLGHVSDVSDWLFAADVLLLPSRLEGHPLVFLEAAAHRCPVVATDAALECYGAAKRQLALIAPTNDTASLIAQVRAALTDDGAVAARVDQAFATVRRHDKAAMISAYKSLLRKIVAQDRTLRASNRVTSDLEALNEP
jgi:glycosyltransferase involved in cell wall biosynthesis